MQEVIDLYGQGRIDAAVDEAMKYNLGELADYLDQEDMGMGQGFCPEHHIDLEQKVDLLAEVTMRKVAKADKPLGEESPSVEAYQEVLGFIRERRHMQALRGIRDLGVRAFIEEMMMDESIDDEARLGCISFLGSKESHLTRTQSPLQRQAMGMSMAV